MQRLFIKNDQQKIKSQKMDSSTADYSQKTSNAAYINIMKASYNCSSNHFSFAFPSMKELKQTAPRQTTKKVQSIKIEQNMCKNMMYEYEMIVVSHRLYKPIKYYLSHYAYEKLAQEILEMKLVFEPIGLDLDSLKISYTQKRESYPFLDAKSPIEKSLNATETEKSNNTSSYNVKSPLIMLEQSEKDRSVDQLNLDHISGPEINATKSKTTIKTMDLKTNINDEHEIDGNLKHINSLFRSNVRLRCRNALILNLKKKA